MRQTQQQIYKGTAKVFMTGRSQAIRLPVECRFDDEEVLIQKFGDTVLLSPKANSWDAFFAKPSLPENESIPKIEELSYENRESF